VPHPFDLPATLQELAPRWAHFCLGVQRFVEEELGARLRGKALLIAFSGGLDSTALLACFSYLAPRLDAALHAVHLDHGLRVASADDAVHCRTVCESFGVSFHDAHEDVAGLAAREGLGVEDAGRRARLALFERVRRETGAAFVLLGHQLDELAEDQVMRLTRGAGWPELGGMPAIDRERALLRPLLLTPKAELRAFAQYLGAPWREDESNTDPAFLRNRVRARILPLLVEENPSYLEAAARLWRLARLDRDHLAGLMADHEARALPDGERLLLFRASLDMLHPSLRLRLCKRALERLGPGQPRMDNLLDLERAYAEGHIGAAVRFPGDKEACVTREGIVFGHVRRDE